MKAILLGSWWVLAFAIITFSLFEQASIKTIHGIETLHARVSELQLSIAKAKLQQEDLKLQIASQNDPAWIEICLIKGLGLIPEGYTKIHYEEQNQK